MSALMLLPTMGLTALLLPLGFAPWLPLYAFLVLPMVLHRRWPFKLSAAAAGYFAAFALAMALDVSGSPDGGLLWVILAGPGVVLALIGGGVWAWQARRHGLEAERDHARAVLARWAWTLKLSKVEPPPVEGGTFAERAARRMAAWRTSTIYLPDGTVGTVVNNNPLARLRLAYLGVKIGALVLGIIFAGSIYRFVGDQLAGHALDMAMGAGDGFARRLGL